MTAPNEILAASSAPVDGTNPHLQNAQISPACGVRPPAECRFPLTAHTQHVHPLAGVDTAKGEVTMIGPQEGIRALEQVRAAEDVSETDKSLAQGLESLIWLLLAEQKKFDELESVMRGMTRILERLQVELIEDHNKDVEALTATMKAMEDLVGSMRRVR